MTLKRAHPRGPDCGITYMTVDGCGLVHYHYRPAHREPIYKYAVVRTPGSDHFASVGYYNLRSQAEKMLRQALRQRYSRYSVELMQDPSLEGKQIYPDARIEVVTWRVGE